MRLTRMAALFLTLAVPCTAYAQRTKKPTSQPRTSANSFEQYPVPIYEGSPAKPNFQSKPGSLRFRTQIRDGIRQGVNFAGHYAIVTFGCGTGCSFGFLVDVKSGRIFGFPLGGEKNHSLSLDYLPNSKLMKARWIESMDENGRTFDPPKNNCVRQEFVLNGNAFKLVHQTKTLGEECYR